MEDTIKLPLDADGVPIRPGDVVYGKLSSDAKPMVVRSIEYTGGELVPWFITFVGRAQFPYIPKCFTHTKPDTLETIEQAISDLAQDASLEYLSDEEIRELVTPLMKRIKRMVER